MQASRWISVAVFSRRRGTMWQNLADISQHFEFTVVRPRYLAALLLAALAMARSPAQKTPLTFDEAFDYVQIQSVKISPDGSAVLICTRRPNWDAEHFERTLWLYRNHELRQLTSSGRDHSPEWSPDGRWIAFLSDRPAVGSKKESDETEIYLISATGGEAFEATYEANAVGAMAWAPDSQSLYFAVKPPLDEAQRAEHKKQWHDVEIFREDDRGDVIRRLPLAAAIATNQQTTPPPKERRRRAQCASREVPSL